MPHNVAVTSSSMGRSIMWHVTLDGAELLSFAGPHAQELAEASCRDLVHFLDVMSKTDQAERRRELGITEHYDS
jgi:hypothetical protein